MRALSLRNTRTRIAAFLVSALALAISLAMTTSSTGAWFSDSEAGAVTANTGRVALAVGANQSLSATFDNLVPGETRSHTVEVINTGSIDAEMYLKAAAPTVTCQSGAAPTGAELSKLILTIAGGMYGGAAASPAQVIPLPDLAKGGTQDESIWVSLDKSAGNAWQGCSVTLNYEIIAQQPNAPAPTA